MSLQFTGDDYDELLNRGGAYIAEYANTKAIPEILRMFSLHRSEALPLVCNLIVTIVSHYRLIFLNIFVYNIQNIG